MRFRELRYPCSFPAELRIGAQPLAVTIVNVSIQGARLGGDAEALAGLEAGQKISLQILGRTHPATVRWAQAGMIGLRFERQLGHSLLAAIRRSMGQRMVRSGWNLALRELGGGKPGGGGKDAGQHDTG